jgi:hypothetical protein
MRRMWMVFGLVVALASVSLAGIADAEAPLNVRADIAVSAAVALTEAHLGGLIYMMGILASTADVQVGIWGGMRDLLRRFEMLPVSFNAWYLLPDGSYYRVEGGLTGNNLSDRAYFPKVMNGETTLGDLVVSKSTGRKSMVMTVPVERSGSIIGALGATVYLDDFSRLIDDALALPDGIVVYASNEAGLITLHSDTSLLLEDVSEAGVDPATSVSAVSTLLGWTFVVAGE